ncbi:unnamed protein product, partial [Symbiodinium necroappetens]
MFSTSYVHRCFSLRSTSLSRAERVSQLDAWRLRARTEESSPLQLIAPSPRRAMPKLVWFLWSYLPALAWKEVLLPEHTVELAGGNDDPLKTWMGSLKFRVESNETHATVAGGIMSFQFHDVWCYDITFEKIDTRKKSQGTGLRIEFSGVGLTCKGKWKTTGSLSWLVVGDGTITAEIDTTKTNKATAQFYLYGINSQNRFDYVETDYCYA